MENDKKKVALSDDAVESICGGLQIWSGGVKNQDTGEKYKLLVNDWVAFGYVSSLGDITDTERIQALLAAGYIE